MLLLLMEWPIIWDYSVAGTAWSCFAYNGPTCSATYHSPFALVHKNDLSQMTSSIGDNDKCTRKIPSMKSKEEDLILLEAFRK